MKSTPTFDEAIMVCQVRGGTRNTRVEHFPTLTGIEFRSLLASRSIPDGIQMPSLPAACPSRRSPERYIAAAGGTLRAVVINAHGMGNPDVSFAERALL
jgi:hypothetical protein